jgi:hypothetical protein
MLVTLAFDVWLHRNYVADFYKELLACDKF